MSPERLKSRAEMLGKARAFFAERSILEVDPCALMPEPSLDANIDVIEATLSSSEVGYLHTSPEYAMKQLLVAGAPDIYFLGHVFRKEERGRLHHPEFTMAEWYRHGFSLDEMIQESCAFLSLFLGPLPLRILSYRAAFSLYTGLDPIQGDPFPLLPQEAKSWTRDTALHYLLSHRIEPHLGCGELTILTDYPPQEAALARVIEKQGESVAERFEIYSEGIELANGYHELSDPTLLRERFESENQARIAKHQKSYPLHKAFLQAMEQGLPDCCGVSVGFDRALLLYHKAKTLQEILV